MSAQTVYGELLKDLRRNSEMLIYSSVSDVKSISLNGDTFLMEIVLNSVTRSLEDTNSRHILDDYFKARGLKLEIKLIESDTEILVGKLREIIGNKLIVK